MHASYIRRAQLRDMLSFPTVSVCIDCDFQGPANGGFYSIMRSTHAVSAVSTGSIILIGALTWIYVDSPTDVVLKITGKVSEY